MVVPYHPHEARTRPLRAHLEELFNDLQEHIRIELKRTTDIIIQHFNDSLENLKQKLTDDISSLRNEIKNEIREAVKMEVRNASLKRKLKHRSDNNELKKLRISESSDSSDEDSSELSSCSDC